MPEYSLHVDEGNDRQYMVELAAGDARAAMMRCAERIDPEAAMAKVEIVEVLCERNWCDAYAEGHR